MIVSMPVCADVLLGEPGICDKPQFRRSAHLRSYSHDSGIAGPVLHEFLLWGTVPNFRSEEVAQSEWNLEEGTQKVGGMLTRRQVLRRGGGLVLSGVLGGALLAACGGDDDDDSSDATPPAVQRLDSQLRRAGRIRAHRLRLATFYWQSGAGTPGGSIAIGINREPDNLDPAVTPYAVSHTVMMNLYDPLIWRGSDGEFYQALLKAWETGTDGTSYTFTLRQDVMFHDDTPFNAKAVQKFFDRVADPETKSGFAVNLLGPYDSTEITDDYNLTVKMSAPFAPALDGMSQAFLSITSPTAVEADPTAFLKKPVGTGFMKFKEWVEGDHITMVRNNAYNMGSVDVHPQRCGLSRRGHVPVLPDHPTPLCTGSGRCQHDRATAGR